MSCCPCFSFLNPPKKSFRPRTLEEGIKACGAATVAPDLHAALDLSCGIVGDAERTDHLFRLLGTPKKDDWLAIRQEFGEPFENFSRYPNRPPPKFQKTILIFPVADLTQLQWQHFFKHLVEYCDQFFPGMSTQLSEQPLSLEGVRCRKNEFGHLQYHVGDVMKRLHSSGGGAYVSLAITVHDLFDDVGRCTDEGGNVGGMALMDSGLGVFSFARAFPQFYDGLAAVDATFDMGQRQIQAWLRRSRHMMVHELTHMFGLPHCVYFHCLMNGGNGPNDSASGMVFLCPVCLHKVVFALSKVAGKPPTLDSIVERYAGLHASLQGLTTRFVMEDFAGSALSCDIAWLEGRLSHLRAIQDALIQSPTCELEALKVPAPTAPSTLPWTQAFDSKDVNAIGRAARDSARDAASDAERAVDVP